MLKLLTCIFLFSCVALSLQQGPLMQMNDPQQIKIKIFYTGLCNDTQWLFINQMTWALHFSYFDNSIEYSVVPYALSQVI